MKNNNLPALDMMWLPEDHTEGTNPGSITTSAHVADNDLALGRIVDTISHSSYWKPRLRRTTATASPFPVRLRPAHGVVGRPPA